MVKTLTNNNSILSVPNTHQHLKNKIWNVAKFWKTNYNIKISIIRIVIHSSAVNASSLSVFWMCVAISCRNNNTTIYQLSHGGRQLTLLLWGFRCFEAFLCVQFVSMYNTTGWGGMDGVWKLTQFGVGMVYYITGHWRGTRLGKCLTSTEIIPYSPLL